MMGDDGGFILAWLLHVTAGVVGVVGVMGIVAVVGMKASWDW